ncbi:MAG: oligosaccharide flippase family protein [Microgenomates group bacterium]
MKNIFYKIGYNSAVQILGKIITTFLSFLSVSILTRYLGQEGFGNFSLAFAYFSIFGIIADWGLQLTMVREIASKKFPKEIYGTYFWIKLFLVLFSTLLAIFCLLFFPYSKFLKIGIILACIGSAIGVLNTYGTVIFQANLRLDLVALVDVITKVVTTIFIVIFVFLKFGFYSIVNTVLIGNLAGSILIIFFLKKFIKEKLIFDFNLGKKLLIKAFPVGFLSILSLLYFKVDTIILSIYRGPSEVGIYSLAYKILENILVLWGFYMATIYPLLTNFVGNKKKLQNLFRNSIYIALGFSLIIIFFGFIFSSLVIKILGGEKFYESILILRILLLSIPLFYLNNLFSYLFLAKENTTIPILGMSITLLINVILNIIFIRYYGYFAASINVLISELYLLTFYLVVKK